MGQHNSSNKRTLRSALKHKVAADTILDSMSELTDNVAAARVKIAADTTGTWDVDYVSTLAVVAVDMDVKSIGQHKRSMRQVLVSAMSHRKLANEIADTIEEAQVSMNALLAKMDGDAGTLADGAGYTALKISILIDADGVGSEAQHKTSLRKSIRGAVSHKAVGDFIIDGLSAIEVAINAMADEIVASI